VASDVKKQCLTFVLPSTGSQKAAAQSLGGNGMPTTGVKIMLNFIKKQVRLPEMMRE